MKTNFAYSVTYTVFDATVNAHRENSTWIRGAQCQQLTWTGVKRLLKKKIKDANLVRFDQWIDG